MNEEHKETHPLFTAENIEAYLQQKQIDGISAVTATKYKSPLYALHNWLGDDKHLTTQRLQAWRSHLEQAGYNKCTVQGYVKAVNNYLKANGMDNLHIPRPLPNDLTGQTFGYLTVLGLAEGRYKRNIMWHCRCKCGNEIEVSTAQLLSGRTTSCGCLKQEILNYHNGRVDGTELRKALDDTVENPNSVSGYVGVYPSRGKWEAVITYKKKRYHLGTFRNKEDAIKARARAKELVIEDAQRLQELLEMTQEHPSKAIKYKAYDDAGLVMDGLETLKNTCQQKLK